MKRNLWRLAAVLCALTVLLGGCQRAVIEHDIPTDTAPPPPGVATPAATQTDTPQDTQTQPPQNDEEQPTEPTDNGGEEKETLPLTDELQALEDNRLCTRSELEQAVALTEDELAQVNKALDKLDPLFYAASIVFLQGHTFYGHWTEPDDDEFFWRCAYELAIRGFFGKVTADEDMIVSEQALQDELMALFARESAALPPVPPSVAELVRQKDGALHFSTTHAGVYTVYASRLDSYTLERQQVFRLFAHAQDNGEGLDAGLSVIFEMLTQEREGELSLRLYGVFPGME